MQHRYQRADLMRSGSSIISARPGQDLCHRSRSMASARSARSALAAVFALLLSGHILSGTSAPHGISYCISSILRSFRMTCRHAATPSIRFEWPRLAELALVALGSLFFCDRSCFDRLFCSHQAGCQPIQTAQICTDRPQLRSKCRSVSTRRFAVQ